MTKKNYAGSMTFQMMILAVLAVTVGWLVFMTGEMISSSEGRKSVTASIIDGTQAFTTRMVQNLLPIQTVSQWEEDHDRTMEIANIRSMIETELLPFMQFTVSYEPPSWQIVSNIDQVPVYFYEDETTNSGNNTTDVASNAVDNEIKVPTATTKNVSYTMKQLRNVEFLRSNVYAIDSSAKVLNSELDAKKMLSQNFKIKLNGSEPKILIYHTHGSEAFKDSRAGRSSDTVIGVGDELVKLLENKYGIPVYHDKTVYDVIDGKLDRNKAYTMSLNGINKILANNPSIEVVIDLHRDGVNPKVHLVKNVNGKPTAQFMFFNGISRSAKNGDIGYLSNPNKQSNLSFSFQMQMQAQKLYPGLARKIYIKSYRYNLHVKPRTLLVEVGANTNTVAEAKNAMEPLAKILNNVIR